MSRYQRPPDGPRSSTPTIFKNGSIIARLRSSDARRSFSLDGSGAEAEISTRAKIDDRAVSTVCLRTAEGLVGTGSGLVVVVDVLVERFLRRKVPPEMSVAAEAGVGGCNSPGSDCLTSGSLDEISVFPCLDEEETGLGAIDGTGATSLAMRASMKVTKVNETLCAGE